MKLSRKTIILSNDQTIKSHHYYLVFDKCLFLFTCISKIDELENQVSLLLLTFFFF